MIVVTIVTRLVLGLFVLYDLFPLLTAELRGCMCLILTVSNSRHCLGCMCLIKPSLMSACELSKEVGKEAIVGVTREVSSHN